VGTGRNRHGGEKDGTLRDPVRWPGTKVKKNTIKARWRLEVARHWGKEWKPQKGKDKNREVTPSRLKFKLSPWKSQKD